MGSTPASGPRRRLIALLIAVMLLGITESMIGPYLVLFGADRLQLSVLEIGVFISLTAVSGMAASVWLGRRYDRRPGRWPAVLAASLAGTGYLLLVVTTSYPLLLLIGVVLLGAGSAVFPQLFALAKSHTDGTTARPGGGTPILRSAWSLAWAIGPLAGGALVAGAGYSWLLMVTACGFCLVVVAVLGLDAHPPQASRPVEAATDRPLTSRTVALSIAGFALFHVAMFSGAVALPLYVTQVLHGSAGAVGLMFSVCAAAEIPAALALLLLPPRWSRGRVILIGMGLMVLYFALVAAFTGIVALVLIHIARGVAIAVVGALGISHMQDLLPAAPGRATTLFANTATAGSLVSGIAAGGISHALGYRAALLVCGVLSGVASVLFLLARRRAAVETEGLVAEPAPPR
ncbi:MFS transporter [Nonomuraea sp. NPDC049709]|uniref:MFS transporter n=1 Tax=Nonomuraea sp. NPDC049709 TaxID=3154736 RepID=UPI0034441718